MKTIIRLLMLIVLLSGWGLAAASLHVIRTPSTITIVPKNRLGFRDTYVDTRSWTIEDIAGHADVTRRLIQLDKTNLLNNVVAPENGQSLQARLQQALDRAHPPANATQPATPTASADPLTVAQALRPLDIVWEEAR